MTGMEIVAACIGVGILATMGVLFWRLTSH
jgi:hypothetical protein